MVPAIVYGRGLEPTAVAVGARELLAALRTEAGLNAIIEIEVDGAPKVLTVAREIQRDAVRGDITHLDFIKVSLDVAITADVSIDFVGTPAGMKDGGIVDTIETTVQIQALPMSIPTSIELDVSDLHIGDHRRVADLPEIDGVIYLDDPDKPLVTVLVPRIEEVEEVVEPEAEGEPGEADGADVAEGEHG